MVKVYLSLERIKKANPNIKINLLKRVKGENFTFEKNINFKSILY